MRYDVAGEVRRGSNSQKEDENLIWDIGGLTDDDYTLWQDIEIKRQEIEIERSSRVDMVRLQDQLNMQIEKHIMITDGNALGPTGYSPAPNPIVPDWPQFSWATWLGVRDEFCSQI